MKKSISLPAKEIVSDDEKGKKFICDVCGHKFWLRISNGRGRLIRSRCHAQGVVVVLTSTMHPPFHIQARWRNVGSRSRNAKGNAESDEQGRNVPKSASVADCPVVALKCL